MMNKLQQAGQQIPSDGQGLRICSIGLIDQMELVVFGVLKFFHLLMLAPLVGTWISNLLHTSKTH
jgi:hypothetical protein